MRALARSRREPVTERDRLIAAHTDAARRIALRQARRCPAWIAREDLVAAGMVGLVEAAARYDRSREEPFLAFAERRIRGAILDELRRGDMMPRRVRQLARKVATAINELERHGEPANDQRVADALGVTVEDYRARLSALVGLELGPLDDEAKHLATTDAGPDAQADQRVLFSRIHAAIEQLGSRDASILALHYVAGESYQTIADQLQITPSRVCQLLTRAIELLRSQLTEHAAPMAA